MSEENRLATRPMVQSIANGATKNVNGVVFYWHADKAVWLSATQWEAQSILVGEKPAPFTEDDYWRCWMNIYSENCYTSMFDTFSSSPDGAKQFLAWEDHPGTTLATGLVMFFGWPIFFILFLLELIIIAIDPATLPPIYNEGYQNIEWGTALWYSLLSIEQQLVGEFRPLDYLHEADTPELGVEAELKRFFEGTMPVWHRDLGAAIGEEFLKWLGAVAVTIFFNIVILGPVLYGAIQLDKYIRSQ